MHPETSNRKPNGRKRVERSLTEFPAGNILYPGLTPDAEEINALVQDFSKNLAVFAYKQNLPRLWIVFLGGTGTGKSTLFNAFCGESLSATGVERPKTVGPVVYAHRNCPIGPTCEPHWDNGLPLFSSRPAQGRQNPHAI